jgi:predicted RND superfamily exporter protein
LKPKSIEEDFDSYLYKVKKSKAYLGLFIILLLTCGFGYGISNLKFSDNFDAFFPKGDQDLAYYLNLTEEFGVYNDFLFIGLESDNVYSSEFFTKVDSLTESFERLLKVESVISPTNFKRYQLTPFGVNSFNVVNYSNGIDVDRMKSDPQLYGQFFGKNDKSVGMILRHESFDDKKTADKFYENLVTIIADQGFSTPIISGKIQGQHDFSIRLKQELSLLLGAAIVLILIMLAIVYRTIRGMLIPFVTLVTTLVWMFGFFGLTDRPIDVLAIMIPPILLVVSMSDVIHLCNKFNDCMHKGMDVFTSIKTSIKLVGLATLLTSITTAIGFFSLAISPIAPIKNFGLYTGIGVLFAFFVTFTTIPCLLLILNKPVNNVKPIKDNWSNKLEHLHNWVIKRRRPIILLSLLLLAGGTLATFSINRNTYLIVGVDKQDPLMKTMGYFDDNFDGNKPFEMTYELESQDDLFERSTLQDLDSIQQYLETEYGIAHIKSPLNLIKTINQTIHGGATREYKLPQASDYSRIKRVYDSRQFAEARAILHSKNGVTLRINGRGKDIGSAKAGLKNEKLEKFLSQTLNLKQDQFRLTGTSFLIDKTDDYIVSSIIQGLILAIIAIAFLILLITKSFKTMLISILPNIIPLLILSGLMGVLGVDLNIATAVIFSIAFGIAVDDSIHFIIRYQLEVKNKTVSSAILATYLSTGKSISLTTVVLFVGFTVFLFSGFSATFYIGLFVATTLVLALITDLTLLPALLSYKKK